MLPVVAGVLSTKRHILVYSILLVLLSFMPGIVGFAGRFYGAVALGLGAIFVLGAARLWASDDVGKSLAYAKSLFAYSILYLFVMMTAIMFDHF